jgi:hypothetical protein
MNLKSMAFGLALAATALVAGQARADETCPSYPKEQWMSEDAVRAKATEMGYQVRGIKEEDGCWEVKGVDSKGAKVEVYLDPVSGAVVAEKD